MKQIQIDTRFYLSLILMLKNPGFSSSRVKILSFLMELESVIVPWFHEHIQKSN